jgi:hypothetical protein
MSGFIASIVARAREKRWRVGVRFQVQRLERGVGMDPLDLPGPGTQYPGLDFALLSPAAELVTD